MSDEPLQPAPISNEEHIRLVNALRESEFLRELAALLASSLELKTILHTLTKRTAEVCEVERCAVWLVPEDKKRLVADTYYLAAPHLKPDAIAKGDRIWPESSIELDNPTMQMLFTGNGLLVIDDLRSVPKVHHIADQFFIRSILFVALKRDNKPIGMLSLDNPGKKSTFSCDQQQLVKTIGQQAAIAISNAQLYKEAQTERRRASMLIERVQSIYNVAHAINSGEALSTILRIAMQHLIEVLSANGGAIAILQENKLSTIYSTSLAATDITSLHPDITELSHCYKIASRGVPGFVTGQEIQGIEKQWYQQFGLHNVLLVPLMLGVQRKSRQSAAGMRTTDHNLCIGFAFINYMDRSDTPSRGEYAFAADIAEQCALAIEKERILVEARQAAALATERANTLDAVFNAMSEGIIVTDKEGKMLVANATAAKFIGVPLEAKFDLFSLLANHPTYTMHGHQLSLEDFPLNRAMQGAHIRGERFVTQRADGHQRTIEVSTVPLYDSEFKQSGTISAFRDVTEQARSDRRIRSALETLLNVVEAIAGLTETKDILRAVLTITSTVLNSERALIQVYNHEQQALLPVHAIGFSQHDEQCWRQKAQLVPTDSLPAPFRTLLAEGHAAFIQASDYLHYPGTVNENQILAVPLVRHSHMFGIMAFERIPSTEQPADSINIPLTRDFTVWDLTLAEGIAQFTALALQEARWKQEVLTARANEVALRDANEQKDQFLAITAHEFRSPLTVIQANNQMMQRIMRRKTISEAQRIERFQESIKAIETQTRQLTAIITMFLEVTQLRRGQLSLTLETLDLIELIKHAVAMQKATTNKHTITYSVQTDAHPYVLAGDGARLTQVFVNLLQNAIKYSPLGGPIEVLVRQYKERTRQRVVEIRVKDHGIGVPEEAKARLFECFYRASNAENSETKGAGLGLYIVAEFLRLHGGSIHVESSGIVGEGSTFICTLPLSENISASNAASS